MHTIIWFKTREHFVLYKASTLTPRLSRLLGIFYFNLVFSDYLKTYSFSLGRKLNPFSELKRH